MIINYRSEVKLLEERKKSHRACSSLGMLFFFFLSYRVLIEALYIAVPVLLSFKDACAVVRYGSKDVMY